MTKFIKDFWQGYIELFTQWPLKIETDNTPAYIKDTEALAHDWEQIGSYI